MFQVYKSVLVLVLGLILAGCDTLNSVRMMQINSEATPVWTGAERVKLKSEFLGEKPYVYANVDGEELLFLVDTGARFPILMDTPKVNKLSLNKGFDLGLRGWGEQEGTKAFQTDIASLDFGSVSFQNIKAAAIPMTKTPYFLREDEAVFDGVIGHDLMRHFTWEFDAKNNAIYISNQPYQPEENAQYLELTSFFSKISVQGDLQFNDEYVSNGEFIIDTGSRHYVKLSAAYPDSNDIKIDSARVTAADFGLSGKTEHHRVVLPSLKLGNIAIHKVKVNLIPSDDEDDWWILGNALLNQFKTVVDYKNEAFYLVPQQQYVTDYNLFGLELRKIRSGEFVVRYVFPDLPASNLDIRVGDLVTEINYNPASQLTLSQYNDLASTTGKQRICIARQTQCFDFESAHIEGYSNF